MSKNINKSSYYCLLCFKYIVENNVFKLEDILSYLENNYQIFIYKETLLKYIRTLKSIGFKFERLNNVTYKLVQLPFNLSIPDDEKYVLSQCIDYFNTYNIINNTKKIKTFDKIKLLIPEIISNEKIPPLINNKIKEIQKYCNDKLRLTILYNSESKITVEPYEVIFIKENWYLKCYNITEKENRMLLIENIDDIKQSPIQNKFSYNPQIVTLKFSKDLAKAYTLKEYEEIIKQDESGMYITTLCYDKIMFFNNILRYMDKCEIISPNPLRTDFIRYVENLYKKYYCLN